MKCIIWYHTEEKARIQIKRIIEGYNTINYKHQVYAVGGRGVARYIGFGPKDDDERDLWCIMPDTITLEHLQEYYPQGWNIAFIDSNIDSTYKNQTIFPMLKLPPFHAYNYY